VVEEMIVRISETEVGRVIASKGILEMAMEGFTILVILVVRRERRGFGRVGGGLG
jgi:hypothetical protein